MSFTRTESERLARLKGCTTGIYCRYGRPTGGGITGPTGPSGYSFFTLGGNQGSLTAGTGSIIVVNMAGPTGTVAYSNILQASQTGYTGSAPAPSPYLKVGSDIIPDRNNVYNIGSRDLQFRSAYFGANTVYIDGVPIGATGGSTIVMPSSVRIGQTVLTASGDTLVLPSNVRLGSMDGPILGATGPTGPGGSGGNGPDGGMTWITTNLLGPAPQIDITDIKVRSSEIFVGWDYPAQQHLTFVDIWVPAINAFSAKLDYGVLGGGSQTQTLVNNQSTQEYIDYKRAATKIPITGIILTNVATDIGYKENWVWHDGSSRAVYRYYHPDFASLDPSVQPLIKLWYSNFSTTTNEGTATLNVFISAGPPGPPRNLVGVANSSTQATLNFNHPLWVDIDDQKSTATIKSYTILYDTSGSSRRYPGPLPQSTLTQLKTITNYNHENALSEAVANLYPDSVYRFNIAAKNSANVDGSGAEVEVVLGPLNAPPKLSGIGLDPSQFYSGAIKRVFDGLELSTASGFLLNLSADGQIQTTVFSSPIQHMDYRGSTATGLMRLTGTVKNSAGTVLSTTTQLYDGFSEPIIIPETSSNGGIHVNTLGITDAQITAEKQGFYLKATNRISMDISGYITPAEAPYTMEIRHEHLNGAGATVGGAGVAQLKMFYDIQPTVPPSFLDISFIPTILSYYYVSGIQTLNGQPSFKVNATISNMGGYFYKSPIINYNNVSNTINLSSSNLDSIINKGTNSLPDSINVEQLITPNLSSTTLFSKEIDITMTVNNLLYTKISNKLSLPFIIDRESVALLSNYSQYPSEKQYININNKSSCGFHVDSGVSRGKTNSLIENPYVPEYTHTPSDKYNHVLSIESTEELQIIRGKFRTKGNTVDGYLNYNGYYGNYTIDYSNIDTNGYRFATFRWELEKLVNREYFALTFKLHGIEGIDIRNEYAYAGNSKLLLFYRFVEGDDTAPTNGLRTTSVWADGNNRLSAFVAANYYLPSDNTLSRGGLGLSPITIDSVNGTCEFPVSIPYPFDAATTIYCRIGLPMSENVAFKNISATLQIS